jgi:alcohol dehydrogenase class IV
MGRFTNPRNLYFGEGSRHEIKNLKGHKAIVVSGGHSMRRGGFLQDVQKDLESAGFEVKLFEGVESDPSVETVMRGAKAMEEFGPDWIVAIGGGSPIDAAKAMWVFYEYPETKFEDIIQPFSFPELRKKAHFCAISSTSGTATEVTAFSVITDYHKGIKYPLADFNITPDVAIVDPELTYSMPAKLCAHTGMDALTHCMEAYVSTAASMFTDANALHGIREVHQWLPKSYQGDHEARAHMHEAQCIAGLAFSSGLLGIVHSMAHKTGAAFEGGHLIHGCANAMYLGKVIQWNSKDSRAKERYAFVAKDILHLPGETDQQLIDNLVQEIRNMNDNLNIPQGINNYANGGIKADDNNLPVMVSEKEFLEKLPTVAANAVQDACTPENPRKTEAADFERLLKCCYYDQPVDF